MQLLKQWYHVLHMPWSKAPHFIIFLLDGIPRQPSRAALPTAQKSGSCLAMSDNNKIAVKRTHNPTSWPPASWRDFVAVEKNIINK